MIFCLLTKYHIGGGVVGVEAFVETVVKVYNRIYNEANTAVYLCMPRYIHSDKEQDNLFIPLRLSDQIVEGTLAATIQYMVDTKIDMSIFDRKVRNDMTGRPAYNPRVLLKLILFAYSNGINSSRWLPTK